VTAILFVCLGNICRSPTAEAVFRKLSKEAGLDIKIDSAGTQNWHHGKPPYGPMQDTARPRGYNMANLIARQVTPGDFRSFDLIIAMDLQNMADLTAIKPNDARATLRLFTDDTHDAAPSGIPDPYYTRDFDGALDTIETCSKALISSLSK